MGDDHDREARGRAQPVEQPEHEVAVGHVQRADRLVAEQQPRPGHDRAGERHPLPLAAGELARVAVAERVGVQADEAEGLRRPAGCARPGGTAGHRERLGDQLADGEVGVEGAQRVLEDELHLARAEERPQLAALQRAEVGALEVDAAGGRADQADGGAGQRGLARAGLADDADDLARQDVEVDVGQGGARCPGEPERRGGAYVTVRSVTEQERCRGHDVASDALEVLGAQAAGRPVLVRPGGQPDRLGGAVGHGVAAARREPAAGQLLAGLRRAARDHLERPAAPVADRTPRPAAPGCTGAAGRGAPARSGRSRRSPRRTSPAPGRTSRRRRRGRG